MAYSSTRQHQRRNESPRPSRGAGQAIPPLHTSVTNLDPGIIAYGIGQELDHMATTHSSRGSNGDNPWTRKTLLTLGTLNLIDDRIHESLNG